ncbi:2OG-Fe(II) oxygenase [Candidatus Woesearchaeota archaeon]|jgi:sporadic carbohydrate cluster 2OG-Fe(II) oxygenase|nr:2OG-Fe(II) oxygenase [Candidatus Woesearchaeota archaeon]
MIKKNAFLTTEDNQISKDYLEQGYFIGPVADTTALTWIRECFIHLAKEELGIKNDTKEDLFLDLIHQKISKSELNNFRLAMINKVNSLPDFRQKYYQIAKPYLDIIVGNELSMQLKVNLSIQLPGDDSSLLPVHADTWSGDSPYEVVVWIPLMDCYRTKSMYILPPEHNSELNKNFKAKAGNNSEDLFKSVQEEVKWLEIEYGDVLLFNQALPHGNRVNLENETRWSMNCRFKGVFTPYSDKKIGEFFEPITLRAASTAGLNYTLPEIS